ncbi:MAG TPA: class I SAM-dependent methyltransferase [Methylomusa anaerophila]|uniref:Methyltransferase type 11 domain-containing protein n=1 Tax=Methylomusa anaerophila TaxID=1930071 RepID=A0A348AK44_9FIRM|nr:class I SAM-dependent methyltransferase [Methylomusa anaerophila]BBB91442.1 hypothetical protein MAMMFC1_02126 [Methylomusa anaerophila]HML90137.1 class I SAM-dependent methyltransferase [Methylomusa anaerophila]
MIIDRSLNYGRNHVREFLQLSVPFKTVVDFGAGLGSDLDIARELNASAELYAVELYKPYIDHLLSRHIRVIENNIERDEIYLPTESTNVVIANQILEHTKELFWIFHEMSRILTVNGYLIIGVPNLASLHNRLLLFAGKHPTSIKANSAHIRGFTKEDLLYFIEECFPGGYKLEAFRGSNFYPFPSFIARQLASIIPNMAWGIFFLFKKQKHYKNEFVEYPIKHQLETNFYLG